MRTYRPAHQVKQKIIVFDGPSIDAQDIFTIPINEEVEVLERDIPALDPISGIPYPGIFLHLIRWKDRKGYINRRYLR